MALHKRTSASPKMPFPGESPTVSLALAAGQKFGLNEAAEAPPESSPSKAGKKKAAAQPAPTRKATAKAKPKSKAKSK